MSKRKLDQTNFSKLAWTLAGSVSLLAFIVWGQSYGWKFNMLNAYQLFPLLGLLAFSLMWSHYISGAIRQYLKFSPQTLKTYFESTALVVLALILLHPGILILQRFIDGFGLPPGSYSSYVAPGLGWLTLLGTASLAAFLLFELRRFYSKRSWWKYVLYLNDIAMVAVFYHGLRLGSQLQISWYRTLWFFYGITLIAAIGYNYYLRYKLHNLNVIKQ